MKRFLAVATLGVGVAMSPTTITVTAPFEVAITEAVALADPVIGCPLNNPACQTAGVAANLPAYNGPRAPTTEPMACVRLLVYERTEIVLVEGSNARRGTVLYFQRASSGHYVWENGIGLAEFCFPKRLIQGYRSITFCNGDQPGTGYHHTLRDEWLEALQRDGHAGDFLSLLGVAGTEAIIWNYPNAYTEQSYTARYGYRLQH